MSHNFLGFQLLRSPLWTCLHGSFCSVKLGHFLKRMKSDLLGEYQLSNQEQHLFTWRNMWICQGMSSFQALWHVTVGWYRKTLEMRWAVSTHIRYFLCVVLKKNLDLMMLKRVQIHSKENNVHSCARLLRLGQPNTVRKGPSMNESFRVWEWGMKICHSIQWIWWKLWCRGFFVKIWYHFWMARFFFLHYVGHFLMNFEGAFNKEWQRAFLAWHDFKKSIRKVFKKAESCCKTRDRWNQFSSLLLLDGHRE